MGGGGTEKKTPFFLAYSLILFNIWEDRENHHQYRRRHQPTELPGWTTAGSSTSGGSTRPMTTPYRGPRLATSCNNTNNNRLLRGHIFVRGGVDPPPPRKKSKNVISIQQTTATMTTKADINIQGNSRKEFGRCRLSCLLHYLSIPLHANRTLFLNSPVYNYIINELAWTRCVWKLNHREQREGIEVPTNCQS